MSSNRSEHQYRRKHDVVLLYMQYFGVCNDVHEIALLKNHFCSFSGHFSLMDGHVLSDSRNSGTNEELSHKLCVMKRNCPCVIPLFWKYNPDMSCFVQLHVGQIILRNKIIWF